MKLAKEISNVIYEALVKAGDALKILWFSVDEVSDYFEVKLHPSHLIPSDLEPIEYDTEINQLIESIHYRLLPKLREKFVVEFKEVNYLFDDVEIVLTCQSVE